MRKRHGFYGDNTTRFKCKHCGLSMGDCRAAQALHPEDVSFAIDSVRILMPDLLDTSPLWVLVDAAERWLGEHGRA